MLLWCFEMKHTTIELYGDVDPIVIETRKSTCKHLIQKAKARITELQKVPIKSRDDELISSILKAIDWNEKIINEEI